MGIFDKRKKVETPPSFASRSEAFAFMLQYQLIDKGAEPMEAAKKANEFAEIFSVNMGIPILTEIPKEGIDKFFASIDKIGEWAEKNPKLSDKVVEYGVPAAAAAIGFVFGKKAEQHDDYHEKTMGEEVDFDKIQ